jgi:hypothetical protein
MVAITLLTDSYDAARRSVPAGPVKFCLVREMARQMIRPEYCARLWPELGAGRPRNLVLIFHFNILHSITHGISRQTADLFAFVFG